MVLDLVAFAILGTFALVGALRGGIASLMGLVTLVSSYATAVWAAGRFGEAVSRKLAISSLLGPAIAGTAGFLVTALLLGAVGLGVGRWARRLRGNSRMSAVNRWLGGLFGAVRGALVVLLVTWLVIWLDAARQTGSFQGLDAVPDVRLSSAAKVTSKVVEGAVEATLGDDDPESRVVARVASRPGPALKSLQAVLADSRVEALQRDRFFWTLVENGSYDAAMNRGSFQAVAHSDELRAHFADLGVIDAEAAGDAGLFRERFAAVLAEVGPRVKGLANDPDLARLAQDPEVTSMLESGDTIGLFRHEGIQRLVAKVSSRSTP